MGGPLGSAPAQAREDVESKARGAMPLWAGMQQASPDAAAARRKKYSRYHYLFCSSLILIRVCDKDGMK